MKDNTSDIALKNSIFRVGKVFSVDGRDIRIRIDKKKNLSHLFYKGTIIKNVSVGGYLKIAKGFTSIIVKVDGEYIKEDKNINTNYSSADESIERVVKVQLLGFIENGCYSKGIKELPLIDNECFLLDDKEFDLIHQFASSKDVIISIGHLALEERQKIRLGVNNLFSSHIGIFGNTGSGKSYTLAKLYRQLFLKFDSEVSFTKNARFLIFDFNGEYSDANVIISNKTVYKLSTKTEEGGDKLPISITDLLTPDIFNILASASEKTQQPFIDRTLKLYKKINFESKDSEQYFKNILRKQIKQVLSMSDAVKSKLLLDYLIEILPDNIVGGIDIGLTHDFKWHSNSETYYTTDGIYFNKHPENIEELTIYKKVEEYVVPTDFISNIINYMYIQLIYDVLNNRAMNEHIAPAINKLKSFQKDFDKVFSVTDDAGDIFDDKYLCVIDLNSLNTKMKKIIPMLLSYKLYSDHKSKKEHQTTKSLNIIIDEAHNILSYDSQRESESWKDFRLETFEEIIKEGRKFGVFLTIASQRPSDISATIISQLHNYIIHRLVNNKDLEMVEKNISYLDKLSVETLPILSTGMCVLSGVMAEMPVIVKIDKIEDLHKPINETIKLTKSWVDEL
ncbi:MAG: ATP-binding protein [Rikenellaceae bacterium]